MNKKSKTLSGKELGNKLLKSVREMKARKVAHSITNNGIATALPELREEVSAAESRLSKSKGIA